MQTLTSSESYESALKRNETTEDEKAKLKLALDVIEFAQHEFQLESDGNYSKVVWLDRPYVTWVVSASEKWKLKSYEWYFPIVGKVPYLGFFNESEAKDEEKKLAKKDFDTYLRGVSAYSTLGWFKDPLLSSMLRYEEHDLVETLIHELVHTTFWVKNSVDFNERLASFLGQKGALIFYEKKEGMNSPTAKLIRAESHDEKIFSEFITAELRSLSEWYKQIQIENRSEEIRQSRIREIQNRFIKDIKPKLKSNRWNRFSDIKLNNARLSGYKTYVSDFTNFEKAWECSQGQFPKFFKLIDKLRSSQDPDRDLHELVLIGCKGE
jgi:predicted aminopeptidase